MTSPTAAADLTRAVEDGGRGWSAETPPCAEAVQLLEREEPVVSVEASVTVRCRTA